MYTSAQVSTFVEMLLNRSVTDQVSDILFTPKRDGYHVRLKVNGEMNETANLLGIEIIKAATFIKELAGLDPKNFYTTQDGSFIYEGYKGGLTKFHVVTNPSSKGENLAIQVLPQPCRI